MQFFFNYCENILKEKTGFQKWNYCVLRGPCLTGYPKQRTGLCSPRPYPAGLPEVPDTPRSSWLCKAVLRN